MTKTYIDSGVLIAAFRGINPVAIKATNIFAKNKTSDRHGNNEQWCDGK